MEPFKPRTKIFLTVGKSIVTFSGNKKAPQIAILHPNIEVRAHKLSTAFKFKAEGYRTIEVSFDTIREKDFKIALSQK